MYQNIDDPEIFLEAVSHKLHTLLEQVEQLEVAGLQGGEMLGAYHGIQVSWFDPREFSEVVHHLGEGEGEGEGGGGRRGSGGRVDGREVMNHTACKSRLN